MKDLLSAIGGASIWHPDAIPASEGELARDVKRWVLPAIDALLMFGSFLSLFGGVPAFTRVYNASVAQWAALVVLIAATLCLIGVSFPKLWLLELLAKCLLSGFLVHYALLLSTLSITGSPAWGIVGGMAAALAVVPMWRIVWLGREYRRRRAASRRR